MIRDFFYMWTPDDYAVLFTIGLVDAVLFLGLLLKKTEKFVSVCVISIWAIFMILHSKYLWISSFFGIRSYTNINLEILRIDVLKFGFIIYLAIQILSLIHNIWFGAKRRLSILKWILYSFVLHWSSIFYIRKPH